MKLRKEMKGSYTIEAALLMGILLPLFTAVIYMGFFLHDRGFLQSAAFETAACISLRADEKDLEGGRLMQNLMAGRLLGTRNTQAQASASERRTVVSGSGSFWVPGMAKQFFGTDGITLSAKVSLNQERPSRRIQKIRGATKVIQTFRRTLE